MSEFNNVMPWAEMKRCIVNPDQSFVGYLSPNNSNNWEDETPVDWSTVESSGQNVFVQIPKFYYSKKFSGDDRIFGVADEPVETTDISLADWKVHPAFYRDRTKLCDDQSANPVEVDFRYAPAFKGWVDSQNRLRSLPNKTPIANKTIGQFRTHAKNMGVGYSQFDYYLLYAIQMLYITEYGNPDSQTAIGRGYVNGNTESAITGATLQYGNNSYGETTGKKQMSYRGIEDLWGNVFHWIDGLYSDSNWNILIGNKGYNDTGAGYTNVGKGSSSNIGGNIRDIQPFEDAGFIIKSSGGSYDTDGMRDFGTLNSGRLACAGGAWSGASAAGAFLLRVNDSASSSGVHLGSMLCL